MLLFDCQALITIIAMILILKGMIIIRLITAMIIIFILMIAVL